jgi:vitamin B12 transporter
MLLVLISTMYVESKGITVTANRFEHLPYQVEVINVDNLLTIDELGEILEKKAGVRIYGNGDPGSLMQAAVRGYTSKHTLIMINGHRVNDPKTGGFDLSTIPLSAVKKIEIVKGSSSVFEGSNAIGGIINIITGKETNHIKFLGNSNTTFATDLQIYKYDINGNLNFAKGKGQRSNTDFGRYSVALNWNDLSFTGIYKDLGTPGVVPDSTLIPSFADSTATSLFDNQQTQFTDFSYSKIFTSGDIGILIEPSITGELLKYNWKYDYIIDYVTEEKDTVVANAKYKTIIGQLNAKFLYKMISLSLNIEKDLVWVNQYTSGYDTTAFAPQEERAGLALSFFHELENINTFVSVREDWFGSFGFYPSFTIGSRIYKPIEIFASIASAFQAPTLNDLYYPNYSNENLKPEYSLGLNGGIKIENITISGHIEEISDRIALDENWIPQNISKTRVYGIDIGGNGKYEDFAYSLIYSYLDGYDEENDLKTELQHQPKHTVTGIISYEGPITTEISGKWLGKKKRLLSSGRPPYNQGWKESGSDFIADLCLCKKLGNLSLGFNIENIFDHKYITNFGFALEDNDYPGMGRYFSLWTEYSF